MLEQSTGHGEHGSVSQSYRQEWAVIGRVVVLVVVVGWVGRKTAPLE